MSCARRRKERSVKPPKTTSERRMGGVMKRNDRCMGVISKDGKELYVFNGRNVREKRTRRKNAVQARGGKGRPGKEGARGLQWFEVSLNIIRRMQWRQGF